jgi:hypothetical protein
MKVGAPPSMKVRETFERDHHGAARVDLDTGTVELLPESTDVTGASVGQPETSAAESNVLEQQEIGDKRFQLVADTQAGGAIKVLVRAVERASGKMLWETLIEEAPLQRPKRLLRRAPTPSSSAPEATSSVSVDSTIQP